MNDGQLTHPEPDPAPFKVHLLTRAGRAMRAHTEPVRAFSTKDEAVRFAGRQLGGNYAVYHKDGKFGPSRMTRLAEVARCAKPRPVVPTAGRGAYDIRALPDLCLGIGSERLGVLEHFPSRL